MSIVHKYLSFFKLGNQGRAELHLVNGEIVIGEISKTDVDGVLLFVDDATGPALVSESHIVSITMCAQ